jgi:hypothetical protein
MKTILAFNVMDDEVREKRGVLRMLLEGYLRCSGGLAKQATGRKPVVCALCTHRPGGASQCQVNILIINVLMF